MTDPIQTFWAYAAEFEKVYVNDDWTLLEPFFSEDAVYETKGNFPLANLSQGREALFRDLKATLDRMDRQFDSRELGLIRGPELRDDHVWMHWTATYRKGDLKLVLEREERLWICQGRITRIEDSYSPEEQEKISQWWQEHIATLGDPQ